MAYDPRFDPNNPNWASPKRYTPLTWAENAEALKQQAWYRFIFGPYPETDSTGLTPEGKRALASFAKGQQQDTNDTLSLAQQLGAMGKFAAPRIAAVISRMQAEGKIPPSASALKQPPSPSSPQPISAEPNQELANPGTFGQGWEPGLQAASEAWGNSLGGGRWDPNPNMNGQLVGLPSWTPPDARGNERLNFEFNSPTTRGSIVLNPAKYEANQARDAEELLGIQEEIAARRQAKQLRDQQEANRKAVQLSSEFLPGGRWYSAMRGLPPNTYGLDLSQYS